MLDKSIPWHSFIMARKPSQIPELPELPDGFRVRPYEKLSDGKGWAEIETSVGEFDSVSDAEDCHRHYLENLEELKKRQWFVVDCNDMPVATCTLWWHGEKKIPCVHAWSCLPKFQHRGFGHAVAVAMLRASEILHPGETVWLETQTWSWRAVGLYSKLGFVPMKTAEFNGTKNEYAEAFPLIKEKLPEEISEKLERESV